MLLMSLHTTIPSGAGAPFNAEGLEAAHFFPYNHSCWCLRPLLMLKALMLLMSLTATVPAGAAAPFDAAHVPATLPADAGAPFDAEGLDAAHVPPYNHSC